MLRLGCVPGLPPVFREQLSGSGQRYDGGQILWIAGIECGQYLLCFRQRGERGFSVIKGLGRQGFVDQRQAQIGSSASSAIFSNFPA